MATWKKAWVKVPDDCMGCESAVCDICAPNGRPGEGDVVCPINPAMRDAIWRLSVASMDIGHSVDAYIEAVAELSDGGDHLELSRVLVVELVKRHAGRLSP